MIAVAWWQAILNFLGSVLAALYKVIPNYGVAIILLTLIMRVVLLPLGIKQIRSMQAMQTIQPKVKAIQQKYKGRPDGKQKVTEETMALYKEHGVNPLGGCLPIVLQFPLLIALFAVLRVPGGILHIPHKPAEVRATHSLYNDIRNNRTTFLGANLLCSAQQAGRTVQVKDKNGKVDPIIPQLKCGKGAAVRIPYYLFALAMIGTTYYQQRQMQRASPPGASQQQQTLTRIMPLLFGIWGFIFPAGLVVYWTTTNLVQIGQQHFMLPKSPLEGAGAPASGDGSRKPRTPKPSPGRLGKTGSQRDRTVPGPGRPLTGGNAPDSSEQEGQPPPKPRRSGPAGGKSRNAGNRKKRRKR